MLKIIRALALAACLATSIGSARAASLSEMLLANKDLLDNPPASCDSKTAALNTFQMEQCGAIAFKAADAALNAAYRKAIAARDAKASGELREAQRHWIAWRDLQCQWESAAYEGGTMAPVAFSQCLVAVTQAQTKRLEQSLKP